MIEIDKDDAHRVAQAGLDIANRTIERAFGCTREIAAPRSACLYAEQDRQRTVFVRLDPAPLCEPCRVLWYVRMASILLHSIEADEQEIQESKTP
jgi:hypothetical protein